MSDTHAAPAAASGLMMQIDAYCERTSFEFWAEPVNAITNASFLIAAIAGGLTARRIGRLEPGAIILTGLILAIGIGSFLFHTVATRWAAIADVLPIQLFIVSYVVLAMRRFFALPWWGAIAAGFVFIPLQFVLVRGLRELLDGAVGASVGYFPAALVLAATALVLILRRHTAGWPLALATGLFAVSLTFRSLDGPLCDVFPLGTHFLWHILNGILLGWLLLTMVRHGPPLSSPRSP